MTDSTAEGLRPPSATLLGSATDVISVDSDSTKRGSTPSTPSTSAIATVVRVHGRWMVAARLVCRQRHDRGTKCSTLRWNSEMAAS